MRLFLYLVKSRRPALWTLIASLLLVHSDGVMAADPAQSGGEAVTRIQLVVERLKAQLGIPERVVVSILPVVALVVSVEAPKDGSPAFRLSFEERFLSLLSEDELDAVVAHELGHVWVFTHHPHLQTERLANQIAMRAVSRETLARVYQKVWDHGGTKGDLVTFLGPDRDAPAESDQRSAGLSK